MQRTDLLGHVVEHAVKVPRLPRSRGRWLSATLDLRPEPRLAVKGDPEGVGFITNLSTPIRSFPPVEHIDTTPFSPDGQFLVVRTDRRFQVYSPESGAALSAPSPQGRTVEETVFAPDSRRLAVACSASHAVVYDLANRAGKPDGKRFEAIFPQQSGSVLVFNSREGGYLQFALPDPALPMPGWVLDLTRLLAGDPRNAPVDAAYGFTLLALSRDVGNREPGYYANWGRWFFSDALARGSVPPLRPPLTK